MTEPDDRDLQAAFEHLTAPPSTADYAHRAIRVDVAEHRAVHAGRWAPLVAGVLTVLIAVAAAGTFLALRNARQNGVATGSGYPTARVSAVMAYDSTSGVTVMYGGYRDPGRAGNTALSDTWLWNGSSWGAAAGPSPGVLIDVHMSDDPADGGVLLTGLPQSVDGGVACAVPGTPVSQSASASNAIAPASPPPVSSPPPGLPSGAPSSPCPIAIPAPSVQTWLFTSHGWSRANGGSLSTNGLDMPGLGAQLAYDFASGEVIAVEAYPISSCGLPLASAGAVQPDLMCPMIGAGSGSAGSSGSGSSGNASSGSAAGATPGYAVPACPTTAACAPILCAPAGCPALTNAVATWTWGHGTWTPGSSAHAPSAEAGAVLFAGDSGSGHARLLTETSGLMPAQPCEAGHACPATVVRPSTTSYSWDGSSWTKGGSFANQSATGPQLAGATVAATGDHALVVTATGELWTWTASGPRWDLQTDPGRPDARVGSALSAGPAGTVVLFGGVRVGMTNTPVVTGVGSTAGADTWTWNTVSWTHVAGELPSAPVAPPACSGTGGGGGSEGCAVPQPAQVSPATPVAGSPPRQTVPPGG